MTTRPTERALTALLAEYRPPPVPDGLAARLADRASTFPQQAPPSVDRERRDRRGRWLRRPLLAGAAALSLAVSGALAATLAGAPLPERVETMVAELAFMLPPPHPNHALRRCPRLRVRRSADSLAIRTPNVGNRRASRSLGRKSRGRWTTACNGFASAPRLGALPA